MYKSSHASSSGSTSAAIASSSNSAEDISAKEKGYSGIDFKKLAALLDKAAVEIDSVAKASEKDICLVIGNTGAGKGTLINQLMGRTIRPFKLGCQNVLDVIADNAVTAISHDLSSHTLFPKIIPAISTSGDADLAYCDCPGFKDNRDFEEKLCSSLGIPLAIKKANNIRAVLVVVSNHDLEGRANGFRELLKILGSLLHGSKLLTAQQAEPRLIFVITKSDPATTKNKILETIISMRNSFDDELVNDLISRRQELFNKVIKNLGLSKKFNEAQTSETREIFLKKLSSALATTDSQDLKCDDAQLSDLNESIDERYDAIQILNLMLYNKDHLFQMNYDGSGDHVGILMHLARLRGTFIKKNEFVFNGNSKTEWKLIDDAAQQISDFGLKQLAALNQLPAEICMLKTNIHRLKDTVSHQNSLLCQLNMASTENLPQVVNKILAELGQVVTEQVAIHKRRIAEFTQQKIHLLAERSKLDVDDAVLYTKCGPIQFGQYQEDGVSTTINTNKMQLTGALNGAAAGFVIGSFFPGIGNLIGGLFGGLFGGRKAKRAASHAKSLVTEAEDQARQIILASREHWFNYQGIPFVSIDAKSEGGHFDIPAIDDKAAGTFHILYHGTLESSIAWLDVYVAKKMHPHYCNQIAELDSQVAVKEAEIANENKFIKQLQQRAFAVLTGECQLAGANENLSLEQLQIKLRQYLVNQIESFEKRIVEAAEVMVSKKITLQNAQQNMTCMQHRFKLLRNINSMLDFAHAPSVAECLAKLDTHEPAEMVPTTVKPRIVWGKNEHQPAYQAHNGFFSHGHSLWRAYPRAPITAILQKTALDLYWELSPAGFLAANSRLAVLNHQVNVMSKQFDGQQNLADLSCFFESQTVPFLACVQKGILPEYAVIEGCTVPIQGLMELLAASRLLGDTDSLGGAIQNAAFVIERENQESTPTVRIIKIAATQVFNFEQICETDDIQYAADKPVINWERLSECQHNNFARALHRGLEILQHKPIIAELLNRQSLLKGPNGQVFLSTRTVFDAVLENLSQHLELQQAIYEDVLCELQDCRLR